MGEVIRARITIMGIEVEIIDDGLQAPGVHLYSVRPIKPITIDGYGHPWIGSGATEEHAIESAEYFLDRMWSRIDRRKP